MYEHIMVDIETMDTSPSALVLSIGAVAFDSMGNLGPELYVEMSDDMSGQLAHGRTMSPDTVKWWMNQSDAAKSLFKPSDKGDQVRVGTPMAVARFRFFAMAHGSDDFSLWSNGANFDNVILRSLFNDYGVDVPWKYFNERCFRTMKNLPEAPTMARDAGLVKHNALDDAVAQATHLQNIFKWLAHR